MLRSDLIPQKDFHKGYWHRSNTSNWYYFKEEERSYSIPENFNYKTVDEDLREIVFDAHQKGFFTTPSCSGHNFSETYFSLLFDKIKEEEYLINTTGLELNNIETNAKLLYLDQKYIFKYSKKEFIKKIIPYHKVGILGIQGNFSYINSRDNYTVFFEDGITFFQVSDKHTDNWKTLHRHLSSIWDS